jgi:leucine dehydrogenase
MDRGDVDVPELFATEQLVLCRDDELGLRAVIAIDDTTLGPGLGGVRFRAYPSEAAGVIECQRLAAAMTLKNAVAELPFGGAKSVILQRGPVRDRTALMRRFGEFVARTGGAYLPGVDMGTSCDDLAHMGEAGADVACSVEDPSPWTALGVAAAIRAAVEHVDARSGIEGVRVLIQGAGHVGGTLARDLAADGAHIILADVDRARAEALAAELGGSTVAADAVLSTPCDVFAPCAVARVAAPDTVPGLACRIIAGAANDTLSHRSIADALQARGIVYVPDFVANAGGVIHIHALRAGWDEPRLRTAVAAIGDRVSDLLTTASASGEMPLAVAEQRAANILAAARTGSGAHTHGPIAA